MREELMRRISQALDGDSLSSDPALQKELREDPDAARYAKDLTRLDGWLGAWPLPLPDDAAFDALTARIEQRFDDVLPAIADVTAPPMFDDDDALRDATAGLLDSGSGEHAIGASAVEPALEPAAPISSPIARVILEKMPPPTVSEVSSSEATGEPLSLSDLELRRSEPGAPPKKKKKKKAPPAVAATGAIPEPPPTFKRPVAPKAPSDRVSFPTPPSSIAAGSLRPVAELPRAKERRPSGAWWAFAAAACVGLGVFGAATMFDAGAPTPMTGPTGSSVAATTTLMPQPSAAPSELPAAPSPTVGGTPVAHLDVAEPSVAPAQPTVPAVVSPRMFVPEDADDGSSLADGPRRLRRGASQGRLGSDLEGARDEAPAHAHATRPIARAPQTITAAPSPSPPRSAPTPSTGPSAASPSRSDTDLSETPDRASIQAALRGVEPTVQACGGGEHGTADVDIVIAGSGRVTTATVHGPFAGTPVGSCIARAVRGARFPPFAQPHFEVTYPFHL